MNRELIEAVEALKIPCEESLFIAGIVNDYLDKVVALIRQHEQRRVDETRPKGRVSAGTIKRIGDARKSNKSGSVSV